MHSFIFANDLFDYFPSKAFDRIEYIKLIKMLKDRNMCPIVLRLLMHMYVHQKIQVRRNNLLSLQHNINDDMKQ